jgi:3-isopropylmalate/(R)-2-methylmalate dehydratase large subunit
MPKARYRRERGIKMGLTLTQKILAKKTGRTELTPGEIIYAEPDLVLLYDWPGLDFLMSDIRIDPDKIVLNIDHFFMAHTEESARVHDNFRKIVKKYGIKNFYDVGRSGIGFQLVAEKGHVKPGTLIMHADSHVSTFGALGAYAVGVGGDMMSVFMLGRAWLKVPGTIRVNVTGKFQQGVTSRDLFEKILGDLGPDGGIGNVFEFSGPAVTDMSIESRMVLCNSIQYLAAETAIINPDSKTIDYIKTASVEQFDVLQSDPDAIYSKTLNYDVSGLEPQIVCPPDVYCIKLINDMDGTQINQAFIGTCASGRMEDLRLAARVLKGKKVKSHVRLLITPITSTIAEEAAKEGLLEIFLQAGAVIGPPTCGPCFGGFGYLLPGEVAITTGTLNVPGRMGSIDAKIYMANPAVVAASAVEGKVTDPRKYL